LVAHFGKGFDEHEAAFAGLDVHRGDEAAPVLAAAHAHLQCRVAAAHDVGDHVLVVGRVVGGAVQTDAKPATHVRKSGKHY
jgi:flavin reductase (DIM6/NTAB) family NADH-FMN oxidoreductase RutF